MPRAAVYRVHIEDAPDLSGGDLKSAISAALTADESDAIIKHIDLFPSCHPLGEDMVALVKFTDTPKFLSPLVANPTISQWITLQGDIVAEFDRNFNGFTPLSRPDETKGIDAEYVQTCIVLSN